MSEDEIRKKVNSELDRAEKIWNDVKDEFALENKSFSRITGSIKPSNIPGFPFVKSDEGKVGDFIALILDIRSSTKHLLEAISNSKGVSQLQRVFYETTAVNTIGLICVSKYKGAITEFLGDGFLALFEADAKEKVHPPKHCAEECLKYTLEIVNPILKERYGLPNLSVGIGVAYSKAIVTLIGMDEYFYPKAIGECIYRASKLCKENNKILYDERIKHFWPSSKGGILSFNEYSHRNSTQAKGFEIRIK